MFFSPRVDCILLEYNNNVAKNDRKYQGLEDIILLSKYPVFLVQ